MAWNGLKKGSFHLFKTPNGLGSFLEKQIFDPLFDPLLDPFFVPKQPIFKAFCDFVEAKMACNGLKNGLSSLVWAPRMI